MFGKDKKQVDGSGDTAVRKSLVRRVAVPTVTVGALLVATGVAWSAATDNLVPTINYNKACYKGVAGDAGVCQTDNAQVTYYMDSGGSNALETVDKNVVQKMMSSEYAPTDLSISYDSTPTWSGSGETDIYYAEAAVPGSYVGAAWCNDPSSTYRCDQTYIRIEGGGQYTTGRSCHETGHAVGLVHGAESAPRLSQTSSALGCMQTPSKSGLPLGPNNKENINSIY
ncbi:hypothetical protein OG292_21915 [Streptomyces sp. NBC_01511]|uniref:hypothetical protein n=1 Tax=unclassified Streptomyces TaxID=2593676 RepID=UPI00386DB76E